MDLNETISILEYYNEWRRGAEIEMPQPKIIGEAIESAIKLLKEKENAKIIQKEKSTR